MFKWRDPYSPRINSKSCDQLQELRRVLEERQLRRQLKNGAKAQDVVTLDVPGRRSCEICLLFFFWGGGWDFAKQWFDFGLCVILRMFWERILTPQGLVWWYASPLTGQWTKNRGAKEAWGPVNYRWTMNGGFWILKMYGFQWWPDGWRKSWLSKCGAMVIFWLFSAGVSRNASTFPEICTRTLAFSAP